MYYRYALEKKSFESNSKIGGKYAPCENLVTKL